LSELTKSSRSTVASDATESLMVCQKRSISVAIVVEVDSEGRVYLPASVRRAVPFKRFIVRVEGERIVLVPVKVGEHYGAAKPAAYDTAEQIDEAVVRETERVLEEDVH